MVPADTDVVLGLVASDLGGGVRQRCIVDVGEGEMAATGRQRHGDCASDSCGRSRDHCCVAVELQHDRGNSNRSRTASFMYGNTKPTSHKTSHAAPFARIYVFAMNRPRSKPENSSLGCGFL